MKKSGIIISSRNDLSHYFSGDDEGYWRFLPIQSECNQCNSCESYDLNIPLYKAQVATSLDLDEYFVDTGIIEVVVAIRAGWIISVLLHTILFPLMGFIAGAASGMILIEHDLASVVLSGVGLMVGIMATRPLNSEIVSIEPALDNKHPEKIP